PAVWPRQGYNRPAASIQRTEVDSSPTARGCASNVMLRRCIRFCPLTICSGETRISYSPGWRLVAPSASVNSLPDLMVPLSFVDPALTVNRPPCDGASASYVAATLNFDGLVTRTYQQIESPAAGQ